MSARGVLGRLRCDMPFGTARPMARILSSGTVAKLLVAAGVAVALFGMAAAITLIALEGDEVVVLRTFGQGEPHEARVWIVEDATGAWIEVASPDLRRRIVADPHVELVQRNGETGRYLASPDPSREARSRVRRLMSEKYGWADAWVGLLVDTSDSIAVRLTPDRDGAVQFQGSRERSAQ